MKKIILVLVTSLVIFTARAESGDIKTGDTVPDFQIQMMDGTTVNMSDLRCKVVIVNFWATWCPPCRAKLAVVQKGLIDKIDSDDFIFIAISRGESWDKVLKFRDHNGYEFPMAIDPDTEIFPLFAESGIPRQYLIDQQGIVRKVEIGFDHADENPFSETIEIIEGLLKK